MTVPPSRVGAFGTATETECPLGTDEIIAEGTAETDQRGLRSGELPRTIHPESFR